MEVRRRAESRHVQLNRRRKGTGKGHRRIKQSSLEPKGKVVKISEGKGGPSQPGKNGKQNRFRQTRRKRWYRKRRASGRGFTVRGDRQLTKLDLVKRGTPLAGEGQGKGQRGEYRNQHSECRWPKQHQ